MKNIDLDRLVFLRKSRFFCTDFGNRQTNNLDKQVDKQMDKTIAYSRYSLSPAASGGLITVILCGFHFQVAQGL